ncbi:hypothetical protein N9Y37_07660 [Luminiphilus sp.]|nr:hypothetical protein [Luminiphilus sp.]
MDDNMQGILSRLDKLEKGLEDLRIAYNENAEVFNETLDIMNKREEVRDEQFSFLHQRVMTRKEKAVWNSKMEVERKQRDADKV